ncbi:unnamed protein product [Arctia plantaginis]|uniref:Uncharacterized protein n=1 Tax=Arctia plantaginis TaxID=874455 RepID=A0A8S0Z2H4_ARCPL|nr:unnamed protein product [Arctia plantaginis]
MVSKAGIAEELEEIKKTTVCDHACGCDKKKIRFKHSYVKIRVTSPDISSFCPCPEECIPGVKSGVFVDNEGIKVTIGSVVSVPSYFRISTEVMSQYSKENTNDDEITFLSDCIKSRSDWQTEEPFNLQNNVSERLNSEDSLKYILTTSHEFNSSASENFSQSDNTFDFKNLSNSESHLESSTYIKTPSAIFTIPGSRFYNNYMLIESVPKTSRSIWIFKSESSLSLTSSSDSTSISRSIISVTDDSDMSNAIINLNSLSDALINVECFENREDNYVVNVETC